MTLVYIDPTIKIDTHNNKKVRDYITPWTIWELQNFLGENEKKLGEVKPRQDPPAKNPENSGPQNKKSAGLTHPILANSVQHTSEDKKNTSVISNNETAQEDLKDNLEEAIRNNLELVNHPEVVNALRNNPELRMKLENQLRNQPTSAPRLERH